MKTRRPTDSTLRNVRAANKKLKALTAILKQHQARIKEVESRCLRIERAVRI